MGADNVMLPCFCLAFLVTLFTRVNEGAQPIQIEDIPLPSE